VLADFCWVNLKARNHLKDLSRTKGIILKWMWIYRAQDMDKWRAVVNAVIRTLGYHKMRKFAWLAEDVSSSDG
jgi:hypothetical protein